MIKDFYTGGVFLTYDARTEEEGMKWLWENCKDLNKARTAIQSFPACVEIREWENELNK